MSPDETAPDKRLSSPVGDTAPHAYIGTSGWNYADWAGNVFYPEGLKPAQWLAFYSHHFDSVEVNNTFYRLPDKSIFEQWHSQTPASFRFTVKASRFITHMKKLAEPEKHMALFLRHASRLGKKLAVVLFQLSPAWRFRRDRLEGLCKFLASQRIVPGVRAALEVRHPSWLCPECLALLRNHNVALVFADWPELPVREPITANFIFVRRHGPGELYSSNYTDFALKHEAREIRIWLSQRRDVFVYFNNDVSAHAIRNAETLKRLLE